MSLNIFDQSEQDACQSYYAILSSNCENKAQYEALLTSESRRCAAFYQSSKESVRPGGAQ
jgi:hypothetical protein